MSPSIEPNAPPPVGISVVVVTLNAVKALRETLLSALDLADPRLCIHVVDGASTDETVSFLNGLHGRPVDWISEPDRGIYDAMNKGWAMVPDDHFVLYLGAGDRILSLPSAVTIAEAMANGRRILVGHCMHGDLAVESAWCDTLYFGNTIHHQALMVQKSLHPKPPFDTSFRVYGDWDFNARLFKRGIPAQNVDGFRSYADPSGVSRRINLYEACRIGLRHGGFRGLVRAYRRHAPMLRGQWKAAVRARLFSG